MQHHRHLPSPTATYRLCILLAAFALTGSLNAQADPYWDQLTPGPYAVGYRLLHELDHSRVWNVAPDSAQAIEISRPIRISMWYPAVLQDDAVAMTFGEYVRDRAPDDYFAHLTQLLERRLLEAFENASTELYDSLLTLRMPAVQDAPTADGRFPLAVYSSGGQAAVPDNGALASYLATHGYVVVAVPQLGSTSAQDLGRDMTNRLETQARDVEYAIGIASTLPNVDRRKLAVIGYSFGGAVAMRIAARNPNVDAIVGLDAAFSSGTRLEDVTGSGWLDIKALRVPLLSLQAAYEEAWATRANRLLDSLHYADRFLGRVEGMVHGDFSEIRGMLIQATIPLAREDEALADAHRGYMAVCRYVLSFLDGVLKNDQAALAFAASSSAENDMDEDLVSMTVREGVDVPIEEELVDILQYQGYDHAVQLLQHAERAHPQLDVITERLLNRYGYAILERGQTALAIDVFRLNATAHPRSANAYASLADAYLANGDSLEVIRNLDRVIELLPSDTALSQEARQSIRRQAELRLRLLRGR